MATEFLMPKLGLTMEEGTITEWLVDDGDDRRGRDRRAADRDRQDRDRRRGRGLRPPAPGRRPGRRHRSPAASGSAGSSPTARMPAAGPPAQLPRTAPTAGRHPGSRTRRSCRHQRPSQRRRAGASSRRRSPSDSPRNATSTCARVRGTGPGGRIVERRPRRAIAATPTASHGRAGTASLQSRVASTVPATAAPRQLADLLGVDLAAVPADPTDGRVTTRRGRPVTSARSSARSPGTGAPPATPTTALPPALAPATQAPTSVTKLTAMRGTIAKRMHESLTQMAQLTLVHGRRPRRRRRRSRPHARPTATRSELHRLRHRRHGPRAAPAPARQLPDHRRRHRAAPDVHVGMAVALDGGLIVPVDHGHRRHAILRRSAPNRSRLAEAARAGSLDLADLEGGTFSVSTLGMFGVDGFTPVINPPNTAILGVGRLRDDLVLVDDGTVTSTKRLTLSLTWDHRAFDGAPAAEFCKSIADLLGDPAALDAPRRDGSERRPSNDRLPGSLPRRHPRPGSRAPAMDELGASLGVTWAEPRENPAQTLWSPDARTPGDPPEVHVLGRGSAAHRTARGSAGHVLGWARLHRRPPRRRLGRRRHGRDRDSSSPAAGRSSEPRSDPDGGDGHGVFTYLQPPTGLIVELVDRAVLPHFEQWWAGSS